MRFLKIAIIVAAIAASLYLVGLVWRESHFPFEIVIPEVVPKIIPRVITEEISTIKNSNLTVEGIVAASNGERISLGIIPLRKEERLSLAAEMKLENMFKYQYFDHFSPSGKGASDLIAPTGYDFIAVGENLASGNFSSDEDLVAGWMNSPGHRENILNPGYKEIGVAARKGDFKGKRVWMAVQMFALPSHACPILDPILLGTISNNEKQLATIRNELNRLRFEIEEMIIRGGGAITEYNEWVQRHNSLSNETQMMVQKYNSQVKLRNECIASYGF